MDPLSIAANVVGVTVFCANLVQSISRFVIEVRDVPDTLTRFYNSIQNLQAALVGIEHALRQRPEQLPFERDHHNHISQIVQSCQVALLRLKSLLPDLREDAGTYDRIRVSLHTVVKKSFFQQHSRHIESYTQVLQLSLTTISLGSLWKTQISQEQIHVAIRNLTDSIRSANLLPPIDSDDSTRKCNHVDTTPKASLDDDKSALPLPALLDNHLGNTYVEIGTTSLAEEITAWQKSATDMAEVLSLYEPDQMSRILSGDSGTATRHLPSDSGIGMFEYDSDGDENSAEANVFDPEPDLPDCPSLDIIQCNFEQNQKIVMQFVRCGIFIKAASYQRKAIGYKTQLAESYQVPFPHGEQADMRELLAEILVNSETRESKIEAQEILESLLKDEVSRPDNEIDQHRRCRLYHKLGKLYLDQGNTKHSIRFLGRAFKGRKDDSATPQQFVLESLELLIKALHQDQAFDEVRGYLEWKKLHFPSPSPLFPPSRKLSTSIAPDSSSSFSTSASRLSFSGPSPAQPARMPMSTAASILSTSPPALESEHCTVVTRSSLNTHLSGVPEANATPLPPVTMGFELLTNSPRATMAETSSELPAAAPSVSSDADADTAISHVYSWCIERHFNVNDKSFRVEVYDSSQNTSPLHLALQEENIELVHRMIDLAYDLEHRDSNFCTPLLIAAGTRNAETTRRLLEAGAKADVCDMNSLTALHRCQSRSGGIKVARLLLQYLPELPIGTIPHSPQQPQLDYVEAKPHIINAPDKSGRTAFSMAMDNGNEKMARFLLAEGANPDITDVLGKTALYVVCERGDERMARCALDYGAYVEVKGPGLRTPLIAAVESTVPIKAKFSLIKLLLEHGADPRTPDANGRTAFSVARATSFSSEIKGLLQSHQQYRPRGMSTDAVATAAIDSSGVLAKLSSHSSRSSSFASRGCQRS